MAEKEEAAEPQAEVRQAAAPLDQSLEGRAKRGERMTLDELARVSGNFVVIPQAVLDLTMEVRPPYSIAHCAAAALHGWNHHETSTVDPLLLTLEDYLSALKAIDPPKGARVSVPHKPACSPYSPHDADAIAAEAKRQIGGR